MADSSQVARFFQYFPEFFTTDSGKLSYINLAIDRATNFISVNIYGAFFEEALYTKTAALVYQNQVSTMIKNDTGIVSSRTVVGEYSVSYQNISSTSKNSSNYPNLYEDVLLNIQSQLGLGLAMITEID
jgi:hypothetical protein